MKWDNDTKRFMIHRLAWLTIFIGVGTFLVLLLPFPFDLISVAGLFFLITFLRGRDEMRTFGGTSGIKNLFGSSSSTSGNQNSPLKYYCMNCGKEHKKIACPKCGSKIKRI